MDVNICDLIWSVSNCVVLMKMFIRVFSLDADVHKVINLNSSLLITKEYVAVVFVPLLCGVKTLFSFQERLSNPHLPFSLKNHVDEMSWMASVSVTVYLVV